MQYRDLLRDREHDIHVVLGKEQGQRRVRWRFARSADRIVGLARRHAGGRLVEQQELRVAGEREAQFQLLLVAVAQGTGERACLPAQPDRGEQRLDIVVIKARRARPEIGPRPRWSEGRLDILEHGEPRKDIGALKRAADAHAADLVRRHPGDVASVDHDLAAVGCRWPVIRLNSVDLPAPFGPITAAISRSRPRGTSDTAQSRRTTCVAAHFKHRAAVRAASQAQPARGRRRSRRGRRTAAPAGSRPARTANTRCRSDLLVEDDQHRGADHRAPEMVDPAEDGHDHHLGGFRPVHVIGEDAAIEDAEQGAGDAAKPPAVTKAASS